MQRRIELDGCHNFRDLGGYPAAEGRRVRWRTVFRSDALHHLTPRGVAQLRDELRVGEVVDLRSTGELHADGRGLLAAAATRFHHLPLFDGDMLVDPVRAREFTLADRYFMMAEYAREPIARVITTIARARAPAVYHCAAGKDRTGVISAVLLALLGVKDAIIVADYAATQDNLDPIIDRLMESQGYREMLEVLPPDTLHAEPETMISLLERVRERYGSMLGYASAIGVGEEDLARLRERLLEDA